MSEINLEEKFPDLRPIPAPPSLSTINGCGFCIYGARDFDDETHTYVKTYFFCLVYVPILALRAYRVADAGSGGWFFLGRVSISGLARFWNCLVITALLAGSIFIGWEIYTRSAGYKAQQKLIEADRLTADGQLGRAARLCREVAAGDTDSAGPAKEKLKDLFDGPVQRATPGQAAETYAVAVELQQLDNIQVVPDLYERAVKQARGMGKTDPRGALKLIDTVKPLAKDAAALNKIRRGLQEQAVRKEPKNIELAADLAETYEALGQLDKCGALLGPFRDQLGITEGARILGQIDAKKGKLDQAHALLLPYAEGRLKKLHEAEQQLENARKEVMKLVLSGKAPGFPLARYKEAGEAERREILFNNYRGLMQRDPAVLAAAAALGRETKVVPVALDLGIVMLRRAQKMQDKKARDAELRRAEKMFRSIQGVAGQSDPYRIYLGQVYYWLDKPAEGRKLFENFLASKQREPTMLLAVGNVLREVGAVAEARALAEEAYRKEKDHTKKYGAAMQRALMSRDEDDAIIWLRRADPASLQVRAELANFLGHQAFAEGRDEEAAQQYRQALATYDQLPKDSAILNNVARIHYTLYFVTGDPKARTKAVDMFQEALAQKPNDSILMLNAAGVLEDAAWRGIIGPAIDLDVLRTPGTLGWLPYLYADEAGKKASIRRVREDKGLARAVGHFDRLLVLSPKNRGVYSALATIHAFTDDAEALRGLLKRINQVELDLTDSTRRALEDYQGKKDPKNKRLLKARIGRYRKIVDKTRPGGGPTFAAAVGMLIQLQIELDALGEDADADQLAALAKEANAAAPSVATSRTVMQALALRAAKALAKKEPEFRTGILGGGKRSLKPKQQIAVALGQEKLRPAVLANDDVRQIIALVREKQQKLPTEFDGWSWAMLRAAHPDKAAAIAKGLLADEAGRLNRAIKLKLAPVNASTALEAYWAAQSAGKDEEAVQILKRCAARGVPLPKVLLGK
jgi:tetratricopeptide (TPR) repeat protein